MKSIYMIYISVRDNMKQLSYFDYNFFLLKNEFQTEDIAYSKVQMRNILIHDTRATGLFTHSKMNCDMINKLYYLKAKQTVMLINEEILDQLIRKFDSGLCQSDQFWHWKVSSIESKTERKFMSFNAMVIDNSLYWKEDIFVAIERQKVNVSSC